MISRLARLVDFLRVDRHTWVQDCVGPHILDAIAAILCVLILVYWAVAGVVGFMFRFNVGVVNAILELQILQHLLHLLLLELDAV
jgi:hypothetical protein